VGGKGLFVKELEVALEEGRADMAVHSLKDVPMELPEGFALACVMEREDPRDAFVSPATPAWTSCPRAPWSAPPACAARCCCRPAPRPAIEPLRGNLDTRLRKLDEGQYDAIVLAAAGLKRLGWRAHPREFDPPDAARRRPGRAGHRGARRPQD
jgi:hydroxymethylbilane synthase